MRATGYALRFLKIKKRNKVFDKFFLLLQWLIINIFYKVGSTPIAVANNQCKTFWRIG